MHIVLYGLEKQGGIKGLVSESWKGMTLWHWNVLIWKRYIRVERNVQENDIVLDVTEFLSDAGQKEQKFGFISIQILWFVI